MSLALSDYGGESSETTHLSLRFEQHDLGELLIFAPPEPGVDYVGGADVAEECSEGDFSAAQILRHDTLEQVAVWHGHEQPRRFARILADIGWLYNEAYLVVEFTGPGAVTCLALHRDLVYPKLYWREPLDRLGGGAGSIERPGFVTSSRTKKLILDQLATLLYEREIKIHDKETLDELSQFEHNYSKHGTGAYSAPAGRYDDRVMALALAVEGWRQYHPYKEERVKFDWSEVGGNIRRSVDPEEDPDDMTRWCHR